MEWHQRRVVLLAGLGVLAACADVPNEPRTDAKVQFNASVAASAAELYIADVNAKLANTGAEYAIARVEWVMNDGDPDAATTVYANDRTLRLTSRWVAGDARRGADGNTITYSVFQPLRFADGVKNSEAAIDASFATWAGLPCSNVEISKRTLAVNNFPSAILGFSGFTSNPLAADIDEIGFVPGSIFDAVLGPGAAGSVLGVTFTFVFGTNTPDGFIPSDIDGDGHDDTAHKEVWYNDAFTWSLTGAGGVDIETVALHENGHALELGHFGKIFVSNSNGKLHASPRSVMNAFILGTLRQPLGTDKASFCGNYASWGS